ncbi:MAG: FAD-dependent monooxygenase [Sandaracinus sp.]|nr:FAD-dependent monooxygenase [Sandaracinus sp.]
MHRHERHALVLGASLGGLLAARVLADHFDRVTLVERDALPERAEQRKGVPQGRHAHGLLASGLRTLESLFPGLGEALAAGGAQRTDLPQTRWILGGRRLRCESLGFPGVCAARPTLEAEVRRRVLALPNVTLRDHHDVLGLVVEGERICGARLLGRRDESAEEVVHAELVVDATGRGSRLPTWLEELGYPAPVEERVRMGMTYTSARVRRRPTHANGDLVVVVGATPEVPRAGAALAVTRDEWIVTVMGYLGARPEPTLDGMRAWASQLVAPDLAALLADTELVSPVATYQFPHAQRRRYERLRRHPEGVIAFGDAICGFNPIFAQGMTVAAHEALALHALLATRRTDGLWRRFYARTRPIVDIPWSIATGNDLRIEGVEGTRPAGATLLDRYLDRLLAVAEHDPKVGTAFLRVTNLLDAPSSLMKPATMLRVLFGRRARPALPADTTSPPSPSVGHVVGTPSSDDPDAPFRATMRIG